MHENPQQFFFVSVLSEIPFKENYFYPQDFLYFRKENDRSEEERCSPLFEGKPIESLNCWVYTACSVSGRPVVGGAL